MSCTQPIPYPAWPNKDPNDVLVYGLDFGSQMALDNTTIASITSVTFTPPDPSLIVSEILPVGSIATFELVGGTDGFQYTFVVIIVTASGTTYSRSATLSVSQR